MKQFVTRRAVVLIVIALLIPVGYFSCSYYERQNALQCVLKWGRLAPFPSSAREIQIDPKVGMFSREFEGSFRADPDDVKHWLSESPGIQDAAAENDGTIATIYHIRAGGGATFAEVIVYQKSGTVKFRVYWS